MSANSPEDLQRIYNARFSDSLEYRRKVWSVLVGDWFSRYVQLADAVLDLGCGYGEFINTVSCGLKFAMDLNPDAPNFLGKDVKFLLQDCSARWALPDASLDAVFTSNFLEHLPDKAALGRTLDEIRRCLRPGGRLIAMGPNIKYLPGEYWDFWDHYLALTEASLKGSARYPRPRRGRVYPTVPALHHGVRPALPVAVPPRLSAAAGGVALLWQAVPGDRDETLRQLAQTLTCAAARRVPRAG